MASHLPLTIHPRVWLGIVAAAALSALLTIGMYRFGRLLTFDGFHYCEFAKQFSVTWPDRFGNHWPFGYPLAGGLLGRLGVPAYSALVLLSGAMLLVWLASAAIVLGNHPCRTWVLLSLGAVPVVGVQLGGILTELPFAAALLLMTVSFGHWPRPAAIWVSVAGVMIAFALRYAGLIALAALLTWTVVQWRALAEAHRRTHAIAGTFMAVAGIVAALVVNFARSGYASGASRGHPPGLAALPGQLADFGWSVPSALLAGGIRNLVAPGSPAGIAIGVVLTLSLVLLGAWGWWRPCSRYSRPLAVTGVGYIAGMAVLKCVGEFDALHNARTFLPVVAVFALLAVERMHRVPAVVVIACAGLLVSGTIAAVRGISREIGADVRPVLEPIRARIRAADTIGINDPAFGASAYFAQPVVRVVASNPASLKIHRFVIAAGVPQNRAGEAAECPREWVELCRHLVAAGVYRYLVTTPAIIALERIEAADSADHGRTAPRGAPRSTAAGGSAQSATIASR